VTSDRKKSGVAFWATVVVVVVLVGCDQSRRKQTESTPGTQEFAETKAVEEIERRNPGTQRREILFSNRHNNRWHITIGDKPPRPGGFSVVIVSDDGTIAEVQGGE
jgi:hypothetical protein